MTLTIYIIVLFSEFLQSILFIVCDLKGNHEQTAKEYNNKLFWRKDMGFNELTESKFEQQMRPLVAETLEGLYDGGKVKWRDNGEYCTHLDLKQGIDGKIRWDNLHYIQFQSKVRQHEFLTNSEYQVREGFPDFTQEYKNGDISPGEWFHLYAQLYFYGWANSDNTGLAAWILFDVSKYRWIVEDNGGLGEVGEKRRNNKCGKSTFYAIPLYRIAGAVLAHYGLPDGWDKED